MTPTELRLSRKTLGYNARRFAEKIGVAFQTISNWETGKTKIPKYLPMVVKCLAIEDRLVLRDTVHRFNTEAYSHILDAHSELISGDSNKALKSVIQALKAHARNPIRDMEEALLERIEHQSDLAKRNIGWVDAREPKTSHG